MYGYGGYGRSVAKVELDTWYWSPCWICKKRTYSHYQHHFTCDNGHDPVEWSRFGRTTATSSQPIPDPETMGTHP